MRCEVSQLAAEASTKQGRGGGGGRRPDRGLGVGGDPVVAKVGGTEITEQQLDRNVQRTRQTQSLIQRKTPIISKAA